MSEDGNLTEYSLTGTRLSPGRMEVDTGDATFVVGREVNPVEYLLGSVLACINSTGSVVARDMDIDVQAMEATVEGDLDYAAYHGEETDARPGLQGLDLTLSVEADADQATLEEWVERIEHRCPVTDNVGNETGIDIRVDAA
jgi:uncharacterized OsmC-like protein